MTTDRLTEAELGELERLRAAVYADWVDDDGGSTDEAFKDACLRMVPTLIATARRCAALEAEVEALAAQCDKAGNILLTAASVAAALRQIKERV